MTATYACNLFYKKIEHEHNYRPTKVAPKPFCHSPLSIWIFFFPIVSVAHALVTASKKVKTRHPLSYILRPNSSTNSMNFLWLDLKHGTTDLNLLRQKSTMSKAINPLI